jgi:hypothetical protein
MSGKVSKETLANALISSNIGPAIPVDKAMGLADRVSRPNLSYQLNLFDFFYINSFGKNYT